jgi:ATP/maltotriose-dependent transcriptional regulator MalT
MSISVLGYAGLGRPREGLGVLAKAQAAASRNGERHWQAELSRLKGELLLLEPRHEAEAQACFRDCIEVARRQGARSLELRGAMSLARLLARQGEPGSARRTLSEVYGGFTEGFDTMDLRTAAAALQDLETIREQQQ